MKAILHVLDISGSRHDLYRALTTQDGLAGWWSTRVNAEPSVGSVIDFRFAGDFNPDMEITALDDDAEVSWRCVGGHEPWADSTFGFRIAELPDGRSRLRFRQDYATELGDDAYGTYNFNWGYYLESLRRYVVEGTGMPFHAE